jgi:hypothetical protein
VSIVSLDYAAETTNLNADNDARGHPFTLPTGAVIDGKNTLQTFNVPGPAAAVPPPMDLPSDSVHPTLPGGAVITGKNTLQIFDTNDATNQPKPTDAPVNQPDEVKLSPEDSPNPETTPSPATVVAVAVETDIIYAEIAPEPVSSTISMDHNDSPSDIPPLLPWYRRRSIVAMMMIVAISLALGLGLYYGLGASDNTIRAAYLTSYINNITFTNRTITPNGASPENNALAWMINNDKTLEISAMIDLDDPYSTRFLRFRI